MRGSKPLTDIEIKGRQNKFLYETYIFANVRNSHKQIIVLRDNCNHYRVKQEMKFDNGVINLTGNQIFHRWTKNNLMELLKDYKLIYKNAYKDF